MPPRPTKRSRSNVDPVPLLERGDPWFNDGNIILQAESKQFRVLRSILSENSSVFADMFTVPQPVDGELVDGCPIVHVSDTAEDLHHVLKALFVRSYCFVDNHPLPLPILAAFLRLGRKYDIQQLQAEALRRLTFEFPSTLEEFDRLDTAYTLIDCGVDTFLLAVIHIARESDCLSVLPTALFQFCERYGVKGMIEALRQSDGTGYEMSLADQRLAVAGWHTLIEMQAKETFAWLVNNDACPQPDACGKGKNTILHTIWFPVPNSGMALMRWSSTWEKKFCKTCIRRSKLLHDEGRQKIWDELPGIFGLPGWEELTRQK